MWVLKEPGAHGELAEGLLEVVILSQWKGRRACGFVEGKEVECLPQRQLFCGSGCTRMSAPPGPQSFQGFLLYFEVLPGLRTVLKPLSSKHFHESQYLLFRGALCARCPLGMLHPLHCQGVLLPL